MPRFDIEVRDPAVDYVNIMPQQDWVTALTKVAAASGGEDIRVTRDRDVMQASFTHPNPGFSEEVFKRDALARLHSHLERRGQRGVVMGNIFLTKISNSTVRGPVATGAFVSQTTVQGRAAKLIDAAGMEKVVCELRLLKAALKERASTTAQLSALVAVSGAEDAARDGDRPAMLARLRGAGEWGRATAEKIGVSVVAGIIKALIMSG